MRTWISKMLCLKFRSTVLVKPIFIFTVLLLGACVTINVYFPAAEAQEAAEEFIDKVIGDDPVPAKKQVPPEPETPPQASAWRGFNPMSLLIADVYAAEADISIRTPAIQAIQDRMADRFQRVLQAHFDSGALGFGQDGLIVIRDATQIPLKDRVSINEAVADDNRDRKAVYREIAVANNHPEWEGQIRETFARQWVDSAHRGWWYQAGDGSWRQK